MSNRIMLNQTSYHGAGAIREIPAEAKARGFKKALIACGPSILKHGVVAKVTDLLDAETLYTRSRNDFTSACAAYRTSLARYMRVTGR